MSKTFLLVLLSVVSSLAQTRVDLPSQSKSADFGLFTITRPWRLADSLPASCKTGEAVFLSSAMVGQQLFICTVPNSWSPQSSTSLSVAEILDFLPVRVSDTVLQIGPVCSSGRPCRARFGERIHTLIGPAEITLSGNTGSGVLYVWIDDGGVRAGRSGSAVLSCNSFCTAETEALANFPGGVLPVAAISYTNNIIDTISGEMDHRAILSAQRIVSGNSNNVTITSNGATGALEVDLNSSLDFGGFVSTRVLRRGTEAARPVSCMTGELYYQTGTSAGIYECKTPGTWSGPLGKQLRSPVVENRQILSGQTGDGPALAVLAAGHEAGSYRVCVIAAITGPAAATSLSLPVVWRSSASGTNQNATLLTVSASTAQEASACRLIHSTGEQALEIDPSDAGAAVYELTAIVERLQ